METIEITRAKNWFNGLTKDEQDRIVKKHGGWSYKTDSKILLLYIFENPEEI